MYEGLPAELEVEVHGNIRIVRLNRPDELNAVNAALHDALTTVWRTIRRDPGAGAVVLTGNGAAFSAGGDFAWMAQLVQDPHLRAESVERGRDVVNALVTFPLPVVAAVNGPAVGLGCTLALLSDIVLIADTAHLADPHVSVGLVAGDGGAAIWPLLTSLLRAKEYLLTGDRISSEDAVAFGLANRVVPAADVVSEAISLAERLARRPRQAVIDTKRALQLNLANALPGPLLAGLVAERESMGSEDFAAILAKLTKQGE